LQRPTAEWPAHQPPLDLSHDHLDRYRVVSAARNDDIRIALARLDELEMHRLHRREVLLYDIVERPTARSGVALDAPDQSDVGVRIDENFHVTKLPDSGIDEQQDAVYHHHVSGLDMGVLGASQMRHEVVLGFFDRPAIAERGQVLA
jgi:hypothetical protein